MVFFAPANTAAATESAANKKDSRGGFVTSQDVSGYQPGLLSGLVLAGANRRPANGEEDGILTALEVEEMDLHRVQLATLSACETGLGQTAGGEGLLGLQRAFQTAGAESGGCEFVEGARQGDADVDGPVLRQFVEQAHVESRKPARRAAVAVARRIEDDGFDSWAGAFFRKHGRHRGERATSAAVLGGV